ncbi:hypothetical protein TSUD_384130 [Trifolium subterraneum]|uniref:BED-type domain-containing protein n=1 Tax=Trifolium subterraneum TaxID=3900 RepID=A0A2Z6NHY0_TRISU|nr:hypothetical protein TSUD_384130 [Trifolium subterraneum]
MSSSIPKDVVGGSSSAPPVLRNSKGNRTDIAWKHGVSVDGGTRRIKCNYCGKVVIGGVYRLKHHLGHTQCNVGACESVPDDVKIQMWELYEGAENEILDFTIESEDLEGGTQNEEHEVAATVELEEDECKINNLDDEFEGDEDGMEDMGIGIDENVLNDIMN